MAARFLEATEVKSSHGGTGITENARRRGRWIAAGPGRACRSTTDGSAWIVVDGFQPLDLLIFW